MKLPYGIQAYIMINNKYMDKQETPDLEINVF